jgi:hypothetical protein
MNIIDIEFIKYIYHPLLNYNKLTNNNDIINYINNNRDKIIYICKEQFIKERNFDYIFYSNYYGLFIKSEIIAIYHYINFGSYLHYITNSNDIKNIDYLLIENVSIEHLINKGKKILFVTHELSLTGGSLIIMEIYLFYKNLNYNLDLLNLNPIVNSINDLKNLDYYDLKSYDLIVINTIAHNVIDWCNTNIEYINKCILWLHETDKIYYTDKFNKLFFQIVICDSYYIRKIFLENYKYTNTLVKVLYLCNSDYILVKNNFNINKDDLRYYYGIDKNSIVFLNIGTISQYKNQITIIKAIEKYVSKKNELLNMKFIFVGNNDNYLTKYINKSRYANKIYKYVLFLPQISNELCYKYYAISNVYINCTLIEPYGRVLIESMEWNLPILAYDGGSHQELIFDNFNGFLYKDHNELLNSILFFYNNKNLIEKYGKNGNLFYNKNIQNVNKFYLDLSSIFSILLNNKNIPNISYENIYIKYYKELNLLESQKIIYENNLYIYGGYTNNSNSINNNIYKFNLLDNSIEIINKIPEDCATTHVSLVLYNDNILIISGQVGESFGKATNTYYVYNITANKFTQNVNLPFEIFSGKTIINENILIVFSGSTADRTTPNTRIWYCIFINENGEILDNPKWQQYDNFTGTSHASLIKTNIQNEYYYLSGCGCHACSSYNNDHNIYSVDPINYKLIFDKNTINMKEISKKNFLTSHTEESVFIKNNILYLIGGQIIYDKIYNGIQLYYMELDLWIELIVHKDYLQYFNKGCICFETNDKLYLSCGQFCSKTGNSIAVFNDTLFIFDIKI